jgi:hypothetical protein
VINSLSGYDLNDWMFLYYVIICPVIIGSGVIISLFEKPTEQFLLKKVRFFEKVGAPWFGKKDYLKYLDVVR